MIRPTKQLGVVIIWSINMKSYFVLPEPLVAANPNAVTAAEMKAYTDQLVGLGPVSGLNSLEDAMTVANEFDPTKKANELFPILEVEHRAKSKPVEVPFHNKNDEVEMLKGIEINSSQISARKTNILMPNGVAFVAAEERKSLAQRLRNGLPSFPTLAMPSVRNRLPEVTLRRALFSVGTIATVIAATAALTFLQVPAMLGLTGYSLLAQAGISLGLVAASTTALTALTVGAKKVASKLSASKVSSEVDADNSVDSDLSKRAESLSSKKPSASNDEQSISPAPAAVIISSPASSSVSSSEAEPEAPKARRSPRLASK